MEKIFDTVLHRNGEVIHAPVGADDLVMLSVERGRYYSVNAVGRRLWELLEQPKRISELCAAICAEFDVDMLTCQADVEKFLADMMESGLVHAAGP